MSDIVYKLIYVGGKWGKSGRGVCLCKRRVQVRAMGEVMRNEVVLGFIYPFGASFRGDSEVAADLIIHSLS